MVIMINSKISTINCRKNEQTIFCHRVTMLQKMYEETCKLERLLMKVK